MEFLVKGYWHNNLGDDLFLTILCNKFPNHNFLIISNEIKKNSSLRRISNLSIRKMNFIFLKIDKALRKMNFIPFFKIIMEKRLLKKSDGLIEIGGSIFNLARMSMGPDYCERRLFEKKNYFIIGCNFGSYYYLKQIKKYNHFFKNIGGVVFRDSYSYNLFKKNNFTLKAPDVVFNLNTDKFEIKKSGYIIISVIDFEERPNLLIYEKNYVDFLRNIIINIISNEGLKIVLMSFCESERDNYMCFKIKNMFKENDFYYKNISVYSYDDIDSSLNLIAGANKLIVSRYHAMILAWIFNKPCFVISYNSKIKNVIRDLYPDQFFCNVSDLKKSNYDSIKFNCITINMKKDFFNMSSRQFTFLDNYIKKERSHE